MFNEECMREKDTLMSENVLSCLAPEIYSRGGKKKVFQIVLCVEYGIWNMSRTNYKKTNSR